MHCFGHRLNLAVKKGLKVNERDIKPVVSAMKAIITLFNRSTKKRNAFIAAQVCAVLQAILVSTS
jgi:hypothetical protein